ncbi:MAG: conjugative transposon protein TraN [Bacteroidota bacterium]
MKKICAVMITGIVALLISVQASAQIAMPIIKDSVIAPYRLAVTYYKTTNLVFPYAIKSVDRGSKDILAQKAKGVENVLQVKAGKLGFDETNLTVITADGKLYSYILNYVDSPSILNISFAHKMQWNPEAFFSQSGINEAEVQADAEKLVAARKTTRGIKDKSYGIDFRLDGIYVNSEVMYFRIKIANETNINYDISQLRFFIRDQKKSKRTATQEVEIYPLHISNDTLSVTGHSEQVFVFAVPKFTIPDKKYLAIQLMEKDGGRNLELSLHNKTIVKAKPVR